MAGSLFRKLLLAAMAATITAVVASNLTFNYTARMVIVDGLGREAADLAERASAALDPTLYEDLIAGRKDARGLRVPMVEELRYVQSELGPLGVENMYVVAPKGSVFYLIADITDNNPAFEVTDEANTRIKREVLATNVATYTPEPYVDSWGSWISGFAPIKDGAGRPIAVLGVDLPMGAFPLMDEIIKRNLMVAVVPAVILALGLSVYLTRRLTRPVRDIIAGLDRVEGGDLSAQVEIRSSDELEQMGRSFNAMTQGLRERERIRGVFHQAVSREIAEEMLKGTVRTDGEIRSLAVLFSDLRGFTKLSEHMPPKEVIPSRS